MNNSLAKVVVVALLSMVLAGCISTRVHRDVEINAERLRKGPDQLPVKNITTFSESLRCMDGLFLSFGVARGDYVLLVEDLKDKTSKVKAGTRQMMITAISDMTKRSGALKLITYGSDAGNLISFLNESGKRGAYQNVPAFDIIGSISQFDDGIYKAQSAASGEVAGTVDGSTIGGGGGQSSSSSVTFLTVDLGVVTSHNLAILPGVNTRNTVALYNRGTAKSYDAGISKTGISYSFSKDSKDAIGQGLRGLIELSTIELIGKLVKLPYWKCLGMPESHQDIENEISDWYYQLLSTGILHKTLKIQLYLNGYYAGPIDEKITPEYLSAVARFKERLGLAIDTDVDLDFYRAFLNQTPIAVSQSKLAFVQKIQAEQRNSGNSEAASNEDLNARINDQVNIYIDSNVPPAQLQVGEPVQFKIRTNTNGYLKCYFKRGDALVRVFPNRFSGNGYISSQGSISLPNVDAFSIVVEDIEESLQCFLSSSKVDAMLPAGAQGQDFTVLQTDVESIRRAYKNSTQDRFGFAEFKFGRQPEANND